MRAAASATTLPVASRPGKALAPLLFLTALLVLGAAYLTFTAVLANPHPTTDHYAALNTMLEQAQPGLAEEDNAWPIYRRILLDMRGSGLEAKLRTEDPELRLPPMAILRRGRWDDPRLDGPKALLDETRPLLARLDEAAARKGFLKYYLYPGTDPLQSAGKPAPAARPVPLWRFELSSLGALRRLARLQAAHMRSFANAGDWPAVAQRFDTLLAQAEHLAKQRTLIEALVAASIHSIALGEAARELNEFDIPPDVCQAMRASLQRRAFSDAPFLGALEGERLILLDALQFVYSKRGVLVGWALEQLTASTSWPPTPTLQDRLRNLSSIFAPSRQRTERTIQRLHTAWKDLFTVSWPQLDPQGRALERQVESHPVLRNFTGAVHRVIEQLRILQAQEAAVDLMLALEIEHAQTGAWPESIDHLGDLAREPATGARFVYHRLEGQAAQDRPYVLSLPEAFTAALSPNRAAAVTNQNPLRQSLPAPPPPP